MANVSRIIPGNTNSTPATIFSKPESLNFLKVKTEIKINAGITAAYKLVSTTGESVIKKNCPANRKANVAKNQIKNPITRTGKINVFFIFEILNKSSIGKK